MSYFVDALLNKYAVLQGRASRAEYWYFFLFYTLSVVFAVLLDVVVGTCLITTALCLLLLVPSTTLSVRRLHDIDRSGWWLWFGAIPVIGPLVLFVFSVTKGTDGPNRYGHSPLEA